MRKLDVGIRIRADGRFRDLIEQAAKDRKTTPSAFIRDAALAEARRVTGLSDLAACREDQQCPACTTGDRVVWDHKLQRWLNDRRT